MDGFDVSMLLRPAVYLLLRGTRVVYVGQSKAPLNRLYSHRRPKSDLPSWLRLRSMVFDGVRIVPTRLEDLDSVEQRLIQKYRPMHNIHHMPKGKLDFEAIAAMFPPKAETYITRRL